MEESRITNQQLRETQGISGQRFEEERNRITEVIQKNTISVQTQEN